MEFVERMFDGVHNVFQLNPATLSGAIDIIVVKHPDGTYHCTPFHVRFGKLQLLRSRDKVVTIMVNDQPVKLKMKLGDAGEAFFVAESEEPVHPMLVTSPLSSPPASPRSRSPNMSPFSLRNKLLADSIETRKFTEKSGTLESQISTDVESVVKGNNLDLRSSNSMPILPSLSGQETPTNRPYEISNLELDSFEFPLEGESQSRNSQQIGWSWGWGRLPTWRKKPNAIGYPTDVVSTPPSDRKDKPIDVEAGDLDNKSSSIPIPSNPEGKEIIGADNKQSSTPPPGWKSKVGSFFRILKGPTPQANVGSILPGQESQELDLDEDSYSDSDFEDTYSEFENLYGNDSLLSTSEPINISSPPATSLIFAGGVSPSPFAGSPSTDASSSSFLDKSSEINITETPENESKPVADEIIEEEQLSNLQENGPKEDQTHEPQPISELDLKDEHDQLTSSEQPNLRQEPNEKEVEEVELAKGLIQELEQSKNDVNPPENDNLDGIQTEEVTTMFTLEGVSDNTIVETKISEKEFHEPITQDIKEEAMTVAAGAAALAAAQGAAPNLVEEVAKEAFTEAIEILDTPITATTTTTKTTTVIPPTAEIPIDLTASAQQRVNKSASTLPSTIADLHIEMSLCGKQLLNMKNLGSREESEKIFAEHIIPQNQFKSNPELLFSTDAWFKINDKIYPWSIAGPVVMSLLLYGQPLDPSVVEQLEKKATEKLQRQESKGWRSWLGYGWLSRSRGRSNSIQPSASPILPEEDSATKTATGTKMTALTTTPEGATIVTTIDTQTTYTIKSLRPTSEELASLPLRAGENKISFTVNSELRGQQQVISTLYLWDKDAKIVISDIDGTITKSDVFGQLMPMLGKDWSHSGVAKLYHNIKENGYHILYLTSRAIGQAGLTRTYLYGLKQGDVTLPPGPVFMSPTRLLNSFNREVIRRKPEEFKIACLKDIRRVFPEDARPFFAGFGNRQTDAISYRTVGIPDGKIFIINPVGEIRIVNNSYKKTYPSLNELVNQMFPSGHKHTSEEYNEWNFWRVPLPSLEEI